MTQDLQQRIVIEVGKEIADLIPNYINNRQVDIINCENYLKENKFEEIRRIGHRIKGSAKSYGFIGLDEIAIELETAAKQIQVDSINTTIEKLKIYMSNIVVLVNEDI